MNFKKPPIVEAVIGITIPMLPESAIADFRTANAELSSLGFELQKPRTLHDFQIKVEEGISSFVGNDRELGFLYMRSDRGFAVQFLRTGFVFSQLGNYTDWEHFTGIAKQVWAIYIGIVGSVELQSFQVRYINKLFLPQIEPWENYIKVYPFLPPDVPQAIFEFFMRLAMQIDNPPGRLTHQQTFLPPEKEGFLTMLLDNDFQFSALGIPLSSIWGKIDEVRTIKDDYFEKFLTDKMREAFNA